MRGLDFNGKMFFERENMNKNQITLKKIIIYGVLIGMALSFYLNYQLYKENQNFKVRMGAEYQGTVAKTLFRLDEEDVNFWIETLQNEENGDVSLESYIGNLNEIINGYEDMSTKAGIIGMQIKSITRQYRELEKSLDKGRNIEANKETIQKNIAFIRNVLHKVQSDLGKSENEVLWYKELSGYETKTGNYIWEQYKKFESESQ